MMAANQAIGSIKAFYKAHTHAVIGGVAVGGLVGSGLYQRHKNNVMRNQINKMWKNSHGYLQNSKGRVVAGY